MSNEPHPQVNSNAITTWASLALALCYTTPRLLSFKQQWFILSSDIKDVATDIAPLAGPARSLVTYDEWNDNKSLRLFDWKTGGFLSNAQQQQRRTSALALAKFILTRAGHPCEAYDHGVRTLDGARITAQRYLLNHSHLGLSISSNGFAVPYVLFAKIFPSPPPSIALHCAGVTNTVSTVASPPCDFDADCVDASQEQYDCVATTVAVRSHANVARQTIRRSPPVISPPTFATNPHLPVGSGVDIALDLRAPVCSAPAAPSITYNAILLQPTVAMRHTRSSASRNGESREGDPSLIPTAPSTESTSRRKRPFSILEQTMEVGRGGTRSSASTSHQFQGSDEDQLIANSTLSVSKRTRRQASREHLPIPDSDSESRRVLPLQLPPRSPASTSESLATTSPVDLLSSVSINKYHVMDALSGLRMLPDACIDCVVTSPPYNKRGLRQSVLGLKNPHDMRYDQCEDDLPEEVYQEQQIQVLNELHRVLKDGGTVWYNHKPRRAGFKEYQPTEWILKSKLNLYGQIIWNLNRSVNQHIGFTTPTYEYVYQLTKSSRPPQFFKKRLPMEYRSSVWTIPPERVKGHPCVFPLRLAENCILASTSNPKSIVLDIYAGAGTTLLAARKTNRHFLGFDTSMKYQHVFTQRYKGMFETSDERNMSRD